VSFIFHIDKMDYTIRKAKLDDREAIERLIIESARNLSREDYSEQQIEAAILTVFGVDTDLILDGTYFVADSSGMLIGCGGWSKRKTLFGGDRFASRDSSELDTKFEAAKIESEARAYGFRSIELMATLPGVKLYQACGYEGDQRVEYEIGDGVVIEFVPMRKDLMEGRIE